MFGSESNFDEQSNLLWSGKRYKRNLESYTLGQNTEYTLEDPEFEETPFVRNPPITLPRRSVTLENPLQPESNPSPSIPVVGQSTPVSSSPPWSTMAHMNDDIKLPVFKGSGSKDPEQFWFLCEAVWTAKNIMDQDIRRAQLVTSFRDWALTWFMKFFSTENHVLANIKAAMIREFKKPKSESQYITELIDIQ